MFRIGSKKVYAKKNYFQTMYSVNPKVSRTLIQI